MVTATNPISTEYIDTDQIWENNTTIWEDQIIQGKYNIKNDSRILQGKYQILENKFKKKYESRIGDKEYEEQAINLFFQTSMMFLNFIDDVSTIKVNVSDESIFFKVMNFLDYRIHVECFIYSKNMAYSVFKNRSLIKGDHGTKDEILQDVNSFFYQNIFYKNLEDSISSSAINSETS